MQRVDSLGKTLMLGGIGGRKRRGRQRMRWLDGIHWLDGREWVWVNSGSRWWTGRPGLLRFMGSRRVGHDWATGLNWTEYGSSKYYLLLLLNHFSRVQLCATPQTAAHQAPLSLGFSRQEHWSGLPFPSPMHESGKWKWSRSVMPDS